MDGPISLHLPISTGIVNAHLLHRGIITDARGQSIDFSGKVQEPISSGTGQNLAYILFHLPNFHDTLGVGIGRQDMSMTWSGRFLLTTDGWKVTVDKVDNYSFLFSSLKASGGYAITHMVKIEREDGSEFNVEQTESLIEDLFYFFSFARGQWTDPILGIGFDRNADQVWERWARPRTDTWRTLASWFDPQTPNRLTYFWPEFYRRLHDVIWGEVLKRAIRWYIAANLKAGELEGAIILAQTGHELLCWTKFVIERGLTSDGFEKLPASDKLRLLLQDAHIPTAVPASLRALTHLCQSENWADGPHAITLLRNSLVHPSQRNLQRLQRLGDDELQDAHILSMWYLELSLLYLLGYRDEYASRLIYVRPSGQTEPVPWL